MQGREFESNINPCPPIFLNAASGVTGTNVLLTVANLVQAGTTHQVVVNELYATGATGTLNWGPDTEANAAAIANFFNLSATDNPYVLTEWAQYVPNTGSTGYSGEVLMSNSSSSSNNVIFYDYVGNVVGSDCVLFHNTAGASPLTSYVRVELAPESTAANTIVLIRCTAANK